MNSNMKFLQRLNEHYDRGLEHGLKETYNPGLIYGSFKRQYEEGYREGLKLRQQQKNKADLS